MMNQLGQTLERGTVEYTLYKNTKRQVLVRTIMTYGAENWVITRKRSE